MPTSAVLRSSSASATRTTSPAGRLAAARQRREATARAASSPFMSAAPRPISAAVAQHALERRHRPVRRPGRGRRRCGPAASATGPRPRPATRATRLRRSGSGPTSSHSTPASVQVARPGARRPGVSLPGRVGGVDPDQRPGELDDLVAQRRPSLIGALGRASRRTASIGNASCIVPSSRSAGPGRDQAVVDGLVRRLVGGGEVAGRARRSARPRPVGGREGHADLARAVGGVGAGPGQAEQRAQRQAAQLRAAASGASVAQTAMQEPSVAAASAPGLEAERPSTSR